MSRALDSSFLRRRFRTALLTLGAQAFKMDGIIQDFEGDVAQTRRRELVQTWMIDIGDAVAASAHQVMVMVGVAVEPSRGFEVIGAPRQS
jgi:hypothetical protein